MDFVLPMVATLSAALFAGGALYVSVAEHPARMRLEPTAALREFASSYVRAAPWQAGHAALSLVAGTAAAAATGEWLWGMGAAAIGSVIPLTLIVILPINRRLDALLRGDPVPGAPGPVVLLRRWGRIHLARSILGAAGLTIFLAASIGG